MFLETRVFSVYSVLSVAAIAFSRFMKHPAYSNSISKVKQGGGERTTKTVHSVRLGVREEANAVSPMKWNWN